MAPPASQWRPLRRSLISQPKLDPGCLAILLFFSPTVVLVPSLSSVPLCIFRRFLLRLGWVFQIDGSKYVRACAGVVSSHGLLHKYCAWCWRLLLTTYMYAVMRERGLLASASASGRCSLSLVTPAVRYARLFQKCLVFQGTSVRLGFGASRLRTAHT